MKKITVLYDMVSEFETHAGWLVDENHAVFRDGKWLLMVKVEQTESPTVFRQNGGSINLGTYEGKDPVPTIVSFIVKMRSQTAYEFLTKTIIEADEELEMELL
jgi:hypothetical protein